MTKAGNSAELLARDEVERLLERVALRDRKAFSQLYDRTCAKLFGVCLRVLGDRAEAEDALQEVYVKVWRNAAEKVLKVKLGTFPNSAEELSRLEQGKPADQTPADLEQLGLKLAPATEGVKDGVAIAEVDPQSDAAQKGLKSGDVILEVQGEVVKSVDDVVAGVKKARDLGRRAVLLHVRTGEQKRFVALQLKKE